MPKEYNIAQIIYCVMCCHSAVCQECVVHVLLIFKQSLSISLTSAGMLSFTRFLEYLLEHVGQIALPEGIWPGQMQRLTTCIKVIHFLWKDRIGFLAGKPCYEFIPSPPISWDFRGINFILLHTIQLVGFIDKRIKTVARSLVGNTPDYITAMGRILDLRSLRCKENHRL